MNFEERMEELQAAINKQWDELETTKATQKKLVEENMGSECGVCNNDNIKVQWYPVYKYDNKTGWCIWCDGCGACLPYCKTFKEAKEMWDSLVAIRNSYRQDYISAEQPVAGQFREDYDD